MKKCKRCRTNPQNNKHRPFCSFECWELTEKILGKREVKYRDNRQHIRFKKNLRTRKHMDVDEKHGLILQMLKQAGKNNNKPYRFRCHTCMSPIHNESKMIADGEWKYCCRSCHRLKLTDKQARSNRTGFSTTRHL